MEGWLGKSRLAITFMTKLVTKDSKRPLAGMKNTLVIEWTYDFREIYCNRCVARMKLKLLC